MCGSQERLDQDPQRLIDLCRDTLEHAPRARSPLFVVSLGEFAIPVKRGGGSDVMHSVVDNEIYEGDAQRASSRPACLCAGPNVFTARSSGRSLPQSVSTSTFVGGGRHPLADRPNRNRLKRLTCGTYLLLLNSLRLCTFASVPKLRSKPFFARRKFFARAKDFMIAQGSAMYTCACPSPDRGRGGTSL